MKIIQNFRPINIKTILLGLGIMFIFTDASTQNISSAIHELNNLFSEYDYQTSNIGVPINNIKLDVRDSKTVITYTKKNNLGGDSKATVTFDLQAATFDSHGFNFILYSKTGIDYRESMFNIKGILQSEKKMLDTSWWLWASNQILLDRITNGFLKLQSYLKENNMPKQPIHPLDNANLSVGKISFSDPNSNNQLDAGETGIIQIELSNSSQNDAFGIKALIKTKHKDDNLQYDQIYEIDKIAGSNSSVVNIPIKATSDIGNQNHEFQIIINYKGKDIANNVLSIKTYNKAKIQNTDSDSWRIKMKKMSGNTFLIACKVNGLPLDFIFDTGASDVTISRSEAAFMLKNGFLSEDDIVGRERYQTASGSIQEGTKIILRKIEINGHILRNVEASIIHSDNAPLLLGQSALRQLGKVQIDFQSATLKITKN